MYGPMLNEKHANITVEYCNHSHWDRLYGLAVKDGRNTNNGAVVQNEFYNSRGKLKL